MAINWRVPNENDTLKDLFMVLDLDSYPDTVPPSLPAGGTAGFADGAWLYYLALALADPQFPTVSVQTLGRQAFYCAVFPEGLVYDPPIAFLNTACNLSAPGQTFGAWLGDPNVCTYRITDFATNNDHQNAYQCGYRKGLIEEVSAVVPPGYLPISMAGTWAEKDIALTFQDADAALGFDTFFNEYLALWEGSANPHLHQLRATPPAPIVLGQRTTRAEKSARKKTK